MIIETKETLVVLMTVALLLCCCCGGSGSGSASSTTKQRIVFFGDSLTEGYTLNISEAYPNLIQQKLNEQELPYVAVNAGVSGDTTTDGLRRIADQLNEPISIFVLALGTNDAARDLSVSDAERNLQQIIDRVKTANPETRLVVAGTDIPQFISPAQSREYREMYRRLSSNNSALFIPNLVEGVEGHPELNLPDGLHPNTAGHQIMAEHVWQSLKEIIEK